jgi:hypothetical protein
MRRPDLEHIIRAAGTIANDDDLIVIGSQAILGQFPDAPASCWFPTRLTSTLERIRIAWILLTQRSDRDRHFNDPSDITLTAWARRQRSSAMDGAIG